MGLGGLVAIRIYIGHPERDQQREDPGAMSEVLNMAVDGGIFWDQIYGGSVQAIRRSLAEDVRAGTGSPYCIVYIRASSTPARRSADSSATIISCGRYSVAGKFVVDARALHQARLGGIGPEVREAFMHRRT